MKQLEVIDAILKERRRQDLIHPNNKKDLYLSIVCEELGEVAKAMQEKNKEQTTVELIQLAASVVRWIEEL